MTQASTKTLSVQEAIETRRSIRQFEQAPLDQGDLREILRLAGLAPSAWNAQTWRFAVVQSPELRAQLQEAAYGQPQVTSAPAVIVLYSDMEEVLATARETAHPGMGEEGAAQQEQTFQNAFGAMSVEQRAAWANAQANIALGYLMIAARGLGYDTVPMLGFQPDKVRELLGLPAHAQIAALLPIGRRAHEGFPHHRHSTDRITKFY
ncbi:nitroreductase family protein [Deinococcus peraridilitoris]|nr:nitroreductase family protein [Deinococcus peraridilitoris]